MACFCLKRQHLILNVFFLLFSVAWRVVYFLTYKFNNKSFIIDPDLVVPITELELYSTLTWTGLNKEQYKLYTVTRSGTILYGQRHFNLLLTREVSIFDWRKIEIDLLAKWCKYLGM